MTIHTFLLLLLIDSGQNTFFPCHSSDRSIVVDDLSCSTFALDVQCLELELVHHEFGFSIPHRLTLSDQVLNNRIRCSLR